jgi:hypothetical protein
MERALEFAEPLVHKGDRVQSPVFQIRKSDKADVAHIPEMSDLSVMCFLHMRKITPEESFRVFMDILTTEQWDDPEHLSGLSAEELAAKFHASIETLKDSKDIHHIAPQTQLPEDHDTPSDFLDFIVAHQTVPLSASSLFSPAPPSSLPLSTLSPSDIVEHLRDTLVSKIAQDHGETPNRIAVGNMWSDPNCINIGEETFVDTLLRIRSLANPVMSASEASGDTSEETEDEKIAKRQQRRTERLERLWEDRVETIFDSSAGVYHYKKESDGEIQRTVFDELDPLEQIQHNILMRRTARLLLPTSHKKLVASLHKFLQRQDFAEQSVDRFYNIVVEVFGPHYAVVEPLFEALLPHVCIVSLSKCNEIMGRHLSSEPRLVALGETDPSSAATGASDNSIRGDRIVSDQRAALEQAFRHFVVCQAELEPTIRSNHIKRPVLRSIPPAWWERVCQTMMDDTFVGERDDLGKDVGLSQTDIDDIVRVALKSEQDARKRVGTFEVDADGKYVSGAGAWLDNENDDECGITVNPALDSLADCRVMLLGVPPYVTEKNIKDSLPNDPSEIVKVEIFGDNFKNTEFTIVRSITDMQVNRSDIKAMRVKSVEVRHSRAFAIVTLSSPEEQQKAQHRYMQAFGARVRAKFYKHIKKDPNNLVLQRQLKRLMGTQPRRRVVYDPETGKPRRRHKGNPPKILTRPVLGVAGTPIHDPIIPNELTARCRIVDVSRMNTLFIKGFQPGLSGYQIADQLSDILQSSGIRTGPIADMNPAGMGSITNMGKCCIKFPNHTMAQKAMDAIASRSQKGTSQLSATWSMPKRHAGEIEMNMAKKVWKTIREIKAEQIDQEEDDDCSNGDVAEEEISGLEKAILSARAAASG